MKLKSAMIRNRGEETRVGSMRKHGRCQLSTGAICSPDDQLKAFNSKRLGCQSGSERRAWTLLFGSADDVGPASSSEWRVVVVAATVSRSDGTVRVIGMERDGCVLVVRGPSPGGSFGVRDGAPQVESSLSSATRDRARTSSPREIPADSQGC